LAALIRDRSAATAEMIAVFGDEALLRAALAFERSLALASAAEGLIPSEAARLISDACQTLPLDPAVLAEEAAFAGTLAIPLVKRLREAVAAHNPELARFVHAGATSQDLADTALMLQAKTGSALITASARRLGDALAGLAKIHAETPMLGRTLLQGALPITLGLRAANWWLGVDEGLRRFERECAKALMLQLGGPVGALTGLSEGVATRLAADLGLAAPPLPWHARRDGVAGLGAALAILTGAVGKIARDVSLMSQGEVAEAFEPVQAGRGGSSAMAHKRNPTGCQVALSAATRAPGLSATLMAGLPQEQERGLGGWQAEAPTLASLFELTHGALEAMIPVIEDLEVDTAAMARRLAEAQVGDDVGHAPTLVRQVLAKAPSDAGAEARFETGLANRRAILGDAWVDLSLARRTPFTTDFQDLITRYAWDEIWGRPGLDPGARRFLVIAITAALGRWEEFRLHVRAGLEQGGFTAEELKEVLMQTAIYAGVPAANTAFSEAAAVMEALQSKDA